jgi:nicotinate phosphoribosyltransferase
LPRLSKVLTTDLYEINMAVSYLRRGLDQPATFSLFVRRLPPERGFLVAAGLADCLSYLEELRFERDDLEYLSRIGFDDEAIDLLGAMCFTGDVYAVAEGRVVLADEPLLEVTAPIAEAQLVETFLLNQITFQTALASKAARCRLAAGDIELFDFALRRAHGAEAGLAVARACAVAGFKGTSNVEAARRFGLAPAGTMAHSYIEAFPSEADAFRAFGEDFPGRATFLVDTFDTDTGIERAIAVIKELALLSTGVRIDSGDLAAQSRAARRLLDSAGLTSTRIFVSGGLDEYALERFTRANDPIDAAGIGMALGVSADAPTLDTAYKIVEFAGRPTMKLSPGKTNLPGAKQVWRTDLAQGDLLATRRELGPDGAEPLLVEVMRSGERTVGDEKTIERARGLLQSDLELLPESARRIESPDQPPLRISAELETLSGRIAAGLERRTDGV